MTPLGMGIIAAGIGQALLVPGNLLLPRVCGWRRELSGVDPLLRDIAFIHCWFLALVLAGFAALSIIEAEQLAAGATPLHRAIAGYLALFWGLRLLLQWTWYSPSHWRGRTGRTIAQIALTLIFASWSLTYAIAALGGAS